MPASYAMSMLEKHERIIGETTYEVTELGAVQAQKMLLRLAKAMGPAVMAVAKGFRPGMAGTAAIVSLLASGGLKGIAESVGSLSEEDLEWISQTFAASTCIVTPEGKRPELKGLYALHFRASKSLEWLEWLEFCIEANYGPFFGGVKAKLGDLLRANAAVKQPAATPPAAS